MKRLITLMTLFLCYQLPLLCAENIQECKDRTIQLQDKSSYDIVFATDFSAARCSFTFTMASPFIRPEISVLNIHMVGKDNITILQLAPNSQIFEKYDSSYTKGTDRMSLGPTNFTINMTLLDRNNQETFLISIKSYDISPNRTKTITVDDTFGQIIDSSDLKPRQQIDLLSSIGKPLSIRYLRFLTEPLEYQYDVFIYDGLQYLGNLADVQFYTTSIANGFTTSGSKLTIIHTLDRSTTSRSILLVTNPYGFANYAVTLQALPSFITNDAIRNTYSSPLGISVYHLIGQSMGGFSPSIPNNLLDIKLDNDRASLEIYAGCIVKPVEQLRIATITQKTQDEFYGLTLHGQCRTFVVQQGNANVVSNNTYMDSLRIANPPHQGVIMSYDTPYNVKDSYTMNYLIQQPADRRDISITYDFSYFDLEPNVSPIVTIEVDVAANKKYTNTYELGSLPSEPVTIGPSYQQMVYSSIPKDSKGFIIRYSVQYSSASAIPLFVSFIIMMGMVPIFD